MTERREHLTTDRARLFVRHRPGGGVPLVLLHGWPESGHCWEGVLQHLGPGFNCIRPDLRGLGDSERGGRVEDYRKAELAQDVIALLDAMGIERFGLVGHDWGGAVAQEIAIAVPERVARLAISNIHLINNPTGLQAAARVHAARAYRACWYQYFMQTPALAEAMVPGNERTWLQVFLRGKDRDWPFPADALAEYVRCYAIAGTPASGAGYYRAMRMDAERWRTLGEYRQPMPTVLVWGRHDPVVIPEFLHGYQQCFDDVRLVELEASHFVPEERPAEFAAALREHFAPLLRNP